MLSHHGRSVRLLAEPQQVTTGMHQLMSVPFLSYYLGSEFHAFTEMVRKSLLALPLGVLLRLAWPSGDRSPASKIRLLGVALVGFCLLLGIEVGQVFLPTRVADVTDALIGEIGFVAGMWVAGMLANPQRVMGHSAYALTYSLALPYTSVYPGSPVSPCRSCPRERPTGCVWSRLVCKRC
jgi:hypothetical protein